MLTLHPQYITNNNGRKKAVVLSIREYNCLLEELEDREDVRLYDDAKKDDDGKRILFSDYLKKRKA